MALKVQDKIKRGKLKVILNPLTAKHAKFQNLRSQRIYPDAS
jgi:hypothetical protein